MPPAPRKPVAKTKQQIAQKIREYAKKRGVTIVLDFDETTDVAKLQSSFSYAPKTNKLIIVPSFLEELDKALLIEIIRLVFETEGIILQTTADKSLQSYAEYSKQNTDKGILQFFEPIINADDLIALKMSLFLQHEQRQGKNIAQYKRDIRDSFGERGSNIANLCTAGYFENEFMSLYNDASREDFLNWYELAVGKKARALFVHRGMDIVQIEDAFNEILGKGIQYHMAEFRIHGLGNANVAIIKKFISGRKPSAEDRFIIQKVEEKGNPPAIEYKVIILYP